MSSVWICERGFNDCVALGDITALGDPQLTGQLEAWLCASPLSRLGMRDQLPRLDWSIT